MDWNRRQFALLSVATLLAPAALAGEPAPQQAAGTPDPPTADPEPHGGRLAEVEVSIVQKRADDHGLVYEVTLTNRHKRGQVVALGVREIRAGDTVCMAWMNDDHPLSRRDAMPSFLDLPPDQAVMAGVLNISVPRKGRPDTLRGTLVLQAKRALHEIPVELAVAAGQG